MKLISLLKWSYEYLQDREDLSKQHKAGCNLELDNQLTWIGGSFYEKSDKRGECIVEWKSKYMSKLRAEQYWSLRLTQSELYKKLKDDGYLSKVKSTEVEE